MTDITHDRAPVTDDGFHEIQLSGKQLVFLFMIAAVVLVATFLCGVQVGRGVRSDRSADATAAEALPTATPPPASTPSQPVASSGPPAAEPPAPAQEPEDELSYAKRLQGDNAPAEKLKSAEDKGSHASTPKIPAAPASSASQTTTPRHAAAAPTQKPSASSSSGEPGAWVVQLQALKNRSDASDLAGRLTAKGYPAFVLDPVPGEPVYYRVQVGGYADRPQADQIARRLEKEEHFKPYVRRR